MIWSIVIDASRIVCGAGYCFISLWTVIGTEHGRDFMIYYIILCVKLKHISMLVAILYSFHLVDFETIVDLNSSLICY